MAKMPKLSTLLITTITFLILLFIFKTQLDSPSFSIQRAASTNATATAASTSTSTDPQTSPATKMNTLSSKFRGFTGAMFPAGKRPPDMELPMNPAAQREDVDQQLGIEDLNVQIGYADGVGGEMVLAGEDVSPRSGGEEEEVRLVGVVPVEADAAVETGVVDGGDVDGGEKEGEAAERVATALV